MPEARVVRGSLWGGIALGQVLALALFAGCLLWMGREIGWVFESHRILVSVGSQRQLGSTVLRELGAFVAAAWFVHALIGFAALLLALLTEKSIPGAVGVRRSLLIVGWFVFLVGMIFAANTTLHPASVFSSGATWWREPLFGFLPIAFGLVATGLLVAVMLVRATPRLTLRERSASFAAATAIGAAVYFASSPRPLHAESANVSGDKPNIVIVGIDSLREDLLVPRRGHMRTPEIRAFLAESVRFSDATTPLARTYPSWTAILTGRHPTSTNARYNLMARASVHAGQTLGDALRARGYRAIYATDEVRFANIDRSFGFDQTVTPPIGAADFLLGYAGDLPLVNLVARTSAGRWLFPSNHANRAAAITYEPGQFLDRVDDEITIGGPTFLAIHLTLAHWPYAWAGMILPSRPETYRDAYAAAVEMVDRQFAGVLAILREKHVLDNAIVVVLSDHGEALGAENDTMLRKVGSGAEIWNSIWGHGTSVLSPNQYHTLLAMRAFGRAKLPGAAGNRDWPVSLEDIRPTLEELVTSRQPVHVDGLSLLPYLAGRLDPAELDARLRFTETDFNTPATKAGQFAASGVFEQAASFYELDQETGWVQLRPDRMAELLPQKERAVFSRHTLLVALPNPVGGPPRYLITDRNEPEPKVLEGSPDAWKDPEARRLWGALTARFPGELSPPTNVPRM